ncbi:hypothetical protein ACJDU8_11705 [Clostridium sp. WILCCON 0269]|uniref:Uncharacterized protein n=1 Tax=Candidatus Clostridium eludens TaxID=3381663 RepID=A0ABW8SJL4_9CLOT
MKISGKFIILLSKHSKAVEKIITQTGLSSGDIFDIIKATVSEIGKDKKASTTQYHSNNPSVACQGHYIFVNILYLLEVL